MSSIFSVSDTRLSGVAMRFSSKKKLIYNPVYEDWRPVGGNKPPRQPIGPLRLFTWGVIAAGFIALGTYAHNNGALQELKNIISTGPGKTQDAMQGVEKGIEGMREFQKNNK